MNQKTRSSSCASRCRWSFFRCSSRIPPWPWTIAFGRPVVPDEYRTQSGWSNGTGSNRSSAPSPAARKIGPGAWRSGWARGLRRLQVGDDDGALDRRHLAHEPSDGLGAVEVLAVVAVAVDAEQDLRLDLREAIDHAGSAEVRRAARPHGADRRGRQEGDQRLGDVRQIGDHAVAALDAQLAERGGRTGHLLAELPPAQLAERAKLRRVQHGHVGVALAAEDVLGVVELGPREPLGAGHHALRQDLRVGGRGLDLEEVPDRGPELLQLGDRPLPQRRVVGERSPALGLEPAHVAGHRRPLDALGEGSQRSSPRRVALAAGRATGRLYHRERRRPTSRSRARTSSSAKPWARSSAAGSTRSGVSLGVWYPGT